MLIYKVIFKQGDNYYLCSKMVQSLEEALALDETKNAEPGTVKIYEPIDTETL